MTISSPIPMTIPAPPCAPTMEEIERLARAFADAHGALRDVVTVTQDEIDRIRRRRVGVIKRHAARCAEAHDALAEAVGRARHLFERPRTRLLHGVRVGIQKGKGEIRFADAAAVVKLIRRHMADRFDELVKVAETPAKAALARLPAAELKRLGVTVEETGDRVTIRVADDEIDRLVAALTDGFIDEVEQGEAP